MTKIWDEIKLSIEFFDEIRSGRVFSLYGQQYRAIKVQSDSERLDSLESRIAKLENKAKKNG